MYHHTVKTYGEEMYSSDDPSLDTRWRWVISFTLQPLYPCRNICKTYIARVSSMGFCSVLLAERFFLCVEKFFKEPWISKPTTRPDDGGSKHLWNVGKLLDLLVSFMFLCLFSFDRFALETRISRMWNLRNLWYYNVNYKIGGRIMFLFWYIIELLDRNKSRNLWQNSG
jgi:hypothetical protein